MGYICLPYNSVINFTVLPIQLLHTENKLLEIIMSIKFATPAQSACYSKVEAWLNELYPIVRQPFATLPVFSIPLGSAIAMVEVMAWGEEETIIATSSFVVTEVDMTPDLMHFLLSENAQSDFGVFSIDDFGNIRLHSTIVGSTCDRQKLKNAVTAVLAAADNYDDQIVALWGGKRALDRMASKSTYSQTNS